MSSCSLDELLGIRLWLGVIVSVRPGVGVRPGMGIRVRCGTGVVED